METNNDKKTTAEVAKEEGVSPQELNKDYSEQMRRAPKTESPNRTWLYAGIIGALVLVLATWGAINYFSKSSEPEKVQTKPTNEKVPTKPDDDSKRE